MQVGRLLTALKLVAQDFAELEIQEKMSALSDATEELVASPGDPDASNAFTMRADQVRATLPIARSNHAAASIRLALKQAGLSSLIGSELLAQLQAILNAAPF